MMRRRWITLALALSAFLLLPLTACHERGTVSSGEKSKEIKISWQPPAANEPGEVETGSAPSRAPRILFDAGHAQTAGSADWVIDGAFSDFADSLIAAGFALEQVTEPLSMDKLSQADIVIIPEPSNPFKISEQEALLSYVESGGILFLIGDHYNADRNFNRWDANEILNGYRRGAYGNAQKDCRGAECEALAEVSSSDWLYTNFGLRFRYNAIDYQRARVSDELPWPELRGKTIISHGGSTLILAPDRPVIGLAYAVNHLRAWTHAIDSAVYFGGREEGPLLALAQRGEGYVLALADSSPLEDESPAYLNEETGQPKQTYAGYVQGDHETLFPTLLRFLLEAPIALKLNETPTPTLAFEIPEKSEEPLPEPWRQPRRGYRWYDPTTFQAGAFGAE